MVQGATDARRTKKQMKTKTTKTIKVNEWEEIPKNFTGIAEFTDGTKIWYKNDLCHREDGPAIEWESETYYLEDKIYLQINLKDYIVLDSYQGNYNLTWYKLLGKDKVIEYPNIPGLITE